MKKILLLVSLFLFVHQFLISQTSNEDLLQRIHEKEVMSQYKNLPQRNRQPLSAPEQDCNSAIPVCQTTFTQPNSYSGIGNTQEVPSSSCLGSQEKNSVWYIFTVQTAGTLQFQINPNSSSDDYDFALYNLTGKNCNSIPNGSAPEASCNFSATAGTTGLSSSGSGNSQPASGPNQNGVLNVSLGETYVLIVSNYSSTQSGYTLSFAGGTASIFDTTPPVPQSIFAPCGQSNLTLQMSEAVTCASIATNGSDFTLTGPGGPFTISSTSGVNCGSSSSQLAINFSPALQTGSTYTLTVKPGTDGNTLIDNCGNACLNGASLNFTVSNPAASITGNNSLCKGSTTTLTASNGTAYLWSPGGATTQSITVSPASNQTYSCTITNGTCGTSSATFAVTVKQSPTANFTMVPNPVCVGQTVTFTNTSTLPCSTGGSGFAPCTCGTFFCSPTNANLGIYTWTFGTGGTGGFATGQNVTHVYTAAGTYTVNLFVTDLFSGCSNDISQTITVNPGAGPLTASNDTTICSGQSINISANGGSTYSWTSTPAGFTASTQSISVNPTTTTTYNVSSPGCSGALTESVVITVGATTATSPISGPASVCANATGNTYSVVNTVGSTYNWTVPAGASITSGQGTNSITVSFGATAGTISVTETNSCGTGTPVTYNVSIISALTITVSPAAPTICSGSNVVLTASGATTYSWLPVTALSSSSTAIVTANPTGTITYTVTGNSGTCTGTNTVTVTVINNPVVSVSPAIASICQGSNTSLTASGATSFVWSPATGLSSTTNATVTATPSGTVTYTVTGTTGTCTHDTTVTVTVINNPVVSVTPASASICQGTNTSLTANGASSYTWSPATGLSSTTGATVTSTPSNTITYTVTGTTGTCTHDTTVTVTVVNDPIVNVTPSNPSICNGANTSLTASGATTYVWSPATGLSSTIGANVTSTPANTITYTVTGTTATCSHDTTVTVTVVNPPVVSVTPSSATVCTGGTTSLTASGAASYSWSPASGLNVTTGANVIATPAGTTTYTITGTTGTCSHDTIVTITVGNIANIVVTPASPSICKGTNTSLTASGATTYVWSPSTGLSSTSGATVTATPLNTITYTVTGTSGTCTHDTTVTVTVINYPVVTVSPASASICQGTNTSLTATGASTYSWSPATALSSTTSATVTATPLNTITYTVTGANGTCTHDTTVTITVTNYPVVSVTPANANVCQGTSTVLTASGAASYLWTTATGLSSTNTAIVTATPASTITYTITGANGICTHDTTVTITVVNNPIVSVTPASAAFCQGGSTSLTAAGAGSYSWLPSTGLSSTSGATVTATPLNTITYTITGTNGICTRDTTVTITVTNNPVVSVTPASATVCQGTSTILTASGAASYSWSAATGLNSTNTATVTATPLSTITYTVTGANGTCTHDTTITITVLNNPVVSVSPTSASICRNGNTSLTASGATSYTWLPIAGLISATGASVTASPVNTVTYTVTGTTGACSHDTTVTVTVLNNPVVNVIAASDTICQGISTSLIAGGATTYTWLPSTGLSGTSGAAVTANPTNTITYTITGTIGSCSHDTTITITVNPTPTISVSPASSTSCRGGSSTLVASGNSTSYIWAPGTGLSSTTGSSVTATPTNTTTYTVTGTLNGCTNSDTAYILVTPLPVITLNSVGTTICQGASTVLSASGATTYIWSPSATLSSSSGSSVTATPAVTTLYTVIGVIGNCNSNGSVTVTVIPPAIANAGLNDTICLGESAQLSGSGGDTYSWQPSTGLNNVSISNPVATPNTTTSYTVNASNGGQCVSVDTVTVYVNSIPGVNAGNDTLINIGDPLVLNGSGQGTLIWSEDGSTLSCYACAYPSASPETSANYYLLVTDVNGCKNNDTVFVEVSNEQAIYIPNSFSPNGDGLNDIFIAKGYGVKEIQMMIFDRWGEKVFDSKNTGKGWDGTFKGDVVKQDVYVYSITAIPYLGAKIRRKGIVTVIK